MARFGLFIGAAAIAGAIALGIAGVAASTRNNDDLKSATKVGGFPFAERGLDTTRFTLEVAEPRADCLYSYEPQMTQTAWYRLNIAEHEAGWYKLDTRGSTYDTVMVIYRRTGDGGYSSLSEELCLDDPTFPYPFGSRAWVHWEFEPGTYYVRVGDYTYPGLTSPHTLDFTVERVDGPYAGAPVSGTGGNVPPSPVYGNPNARAPRVMRNDDIRRATPLRSVPFIQSFLDVTNATVQDGEPMPTCIGTAPLVTHTVWYRLEVPAEIAGLYLIQAYGSNYPMSVSVYRSSDGSADFGALTPQCIPILDEGVYYIQVGARSGEALPAQLELSLSIRQWPNGVSP